MSRKMYSMFLLFTYFGTSFAPSRMIAAPQGVGPIAFTNLFSPFFEDRGNLKVAIQQLFAIFCQRSGFLGGIIFAAKLNFNDQQSIVLLNAKTAAAAFLEAQGYPAEYGTFNLRLNDFMQFLDDDCSSVVSLASDDYSDDSSVCSIKKSPSAMPTSPEVSPYFLAVMDALFGATNENPLTIKLLDDEIQVVDVAGRVLGETADFMFKGSPTQGFLLTSAGIERLMTNFSIPIEVPLH